MTALSNGLCFAFPSDGKLINDHMGVESERMICLPRDVKGHSLVLARHLVPSLGRNDPFPFVAPIHPMIRHKRCNRRTLAVIRGFTPLNKSLALTRVYVMR
jgi:hypothetical protein